MCIHTFQTVQSMYNNTNLSNILSTFKNAFKPDLLMTFSIQVGILSVTGQDIDSIQCSSKKRETNALMRYDTGVCDGQRSFNHVITCNKKLHLPVKSIFTSICNDIQSLGSFRVLEPCHYKLIQECDIRVLSK